MQKHAYGRASGSSYEVFRVQLFFTDLCPFFEKKLLKNSFHQKMHNEENIRLS